jgi:hypothetical protein
MAAAALFERRSSRGLVVGLALGLGFFAGVGRMAVGGHYFSDVLGSAWAVGLSWWLVHVFWYAWYAREWVRVRQGPASLLAKGQWFPVAKWTAWVVGGACLIAGGLLSFPYGQRDELEVPWPNDACSTTQDGIRFRVEDPTHSLCGQESYFWPKGKSLRVVMEGQGFAFPWSRVIWSYQVHQEQGTGEWTLHLAYDVSGLFGELQLTVRLPDELRLAI